MRSTRNGPARRARPAAWCRCRRSTTASRSRSRRWRWRSGGLFLAVDLGDVVHAAGAAARAVHQREDRLLGLLVEVGVVQHGARLLLEQLVQRRAAAAEENLRL